jgi:hypothetical protein
MGTVCSTSATTPDVRTPDFARLCDAAALPASRFGPTTSNIARTRIFTQNQELEITFLCKEVTVAMLLLSFLHMRRKSSILLSLPNFQTLNYKDLSASIKPEQTRKNWS